MNITMKNFEPKTVKDITAFLKGNQSVDFEIESREEKYACIQSTLVHTRYTILSKKDKGVVKSYLAKVTRYEERQLKRLLKQWRKSGLRYKKRTVVGASVRVYKPEDITLLIKTDVAHKTPNGKAVREILKREFFVFGKTMYQTIANISVSHIYNLRKNNQQYLTSEAIKYSKTNPVKTNIGERQKPLPYGKPSFIRVDSVHQGDLDGEKGVYPLVSRLTF